MEMAVKLIDLQISRQHFKKLDFLNKGKLNHKGQFYA